MGPKDRDGSPGRIILIHGGPDRGDQNQVPLHLARYGLPPGSVIDYVVVTHPHTDHHEGLLDILDQYEVRVILDSGFPRGAVRRVRYEGRDRDGQRPAEHARQTAAEPTLNKSLLEQLPLHTIPSLARV